MGKIFKLLGNIIIIVIIVACLPLAVPRFMGLQEYNVISGSMEPQIPVGSLVYVKASDFNNLSTGDVIAFEAGASVVTHRIVSIDASNLLITTKGDANNAADFMPVAYTNVLGRVVFHIPLLGVIAAALTETAGKIIAFIILILGVLLSSIADKKQPKNEEGQREPKRGVNPKIILALGLVIVIGSLGGFLYIYMDYQKDKDYYASLQNTYYKTLEDSEDEGEVAWYEKNQVDISTLQSKYPDVIGWLYVEDTDISYPILYSGDDSTYLRANADKEYAKAGSIFLEGYNLPDLTDSHNIIYGHNMRNLSMFGTLKYYKTEDDYYDNHKYFQVITADGKQRYEIFSYFDTEPASWVYTVPYADNDEFSDYIKNLQKKSYQKIDAEVKSSDQVITLSTCSSEGMRFTVHGYLCDTYTK